MGKSFKKKYVAAQQVSVKSSSCAEIKAKLIEIYQANLF